jgi:hypothetical protein
MLNIAALILLAALLVPGSSMAEIGSIRTDKEVKKDFEAYRYDSFYRYYFLKLENNPQAVIGIRNNFTFRDIAWTEVDPKSEKFKKVIDLVRLFPRTVHPTTGAYILDAQKRTIGVWYSSLNVGVVVDDGRKTVFIAPQTIGSGR